jgi:FixJ family two-component response regulator
MQQRTPGMRVLFTSGHADDPALAGVTFGPGRDLLWKPYDAAALIAAVRRALEATPAPA